MLHFNPETAITSWHTKGEAPLLIDDLSLLNEKIDVKTILNGFIPAHVIIAEEWDTEWMVINDMTQPRYLAVRVEHLPTKQAMLFKAKMMNTFEMVELSEHKLSEIKDAREIIDLLGLPQANWSVSATKNGYSVRSIDGYNLIKIENKFITNISRRLLVDVTLEGEVTHLSVVQNIPATLPLIKETATLLKAVLADKSYKDNIDFTVY